MFTNITGILGAIVQFGFGGPKLKSDSGTFHVRNAADNAFANILIGEPTADNHGVTLHHFLTKQTSVIVAAEASCAASIPQNTASRRLVAVSAAGNGAVLGDLLYDNGLNDSADMEIIAAPDGTLISVTTALATLGLAAWHIYSRNDHVWTDMTPIAGVQRIEFAIGANAAYASTASIPAGYKVDRCDVQITTPYSATATITVGSDSSASLLQATTSNNPQAAETYSFEQNTTWVATGASSTVRVALGGTHTDGVGSVIVWYSPLNA